MNWELTIPTVGWRFEDALIQGNHFAHLTGRRYKVHKLRILGIWVAVPVG